MRFAFYSTINGVSWGGSEELWSAAAEALLAQGHQARFPFRRRRHVPQPLRPLLDMGAELTPRRGPFLGRKLRRLFKRVQSREQPHLQWLRRAEPDFVLISVSYHMDDLTIAHACRSAGIPYGLLVQAASPYQWLDPRNAEAHRRAYANAAQCYFVSEQNRDILESNLGLDLSRSVIVDNPFNVSVDAQPQWPEATDVWSLACVARIHFQSKAQDLLLQVLRQPKWRGRSLEVTLYGSDGGSLPQLEALVDLYQLQDKVKLGGFVDGIEEVWRRHQGLILPSRYEGNPLALTEAMLCRRMPIATNVGRVAELVDDNASGFVAAAATVELIDDALERAWQRRDEWQVIGARAGQAVRERHSLRPAEDFAEALLSASQPRRRMAALAA